MHDKQQIMLIKMTREEHKEQGKYTAYKDGFHQTIILQQ
jgi:hypothetical protein